MKELQVPTRSIAVEVFTGPGERLEGELYTADFPHARGPLDALCMVLNDDRSFLPFLSRAPETGRSILNKAQISRVRPLEASDPDAPASSEAVRACEIELIDGTLLCGELFLETPAAASRLVDKLNQSPTFLQLLTREGLLLVGGRHVARVTESGR